MIIAVASGKGGTGKTSIALGLAQAFAAPIDLFDCDVEEPNAHLFLSGETIAEEIVTIATPEFDTDKCDACDKCVAFCQFNALASVGKAPLLFPDLCHGCGGCMMVCPLNAITEKQSRIGTIRTSRNGPITLKTGCLDVGISRASTLVHALKKQIDGAATTILDSPPGTACQAVAALHGTDFVVLVTEPTPFGLHDLKLAVDTVRTLGIPFGVVINRNGSGDARVHRYCADENIALLLEIPDDRRIAEAYSRGKLTIDALPEYRAHFERLWENIEMQCTGGGQA